jgi:hypothetical protein
MICRDCLKPCNESYTATLREEKADLVRCDECFAQFRKREGRRLRKRADIYYRHVADSWRQELGLFYDVTCAGCRALGRKRSASRPH